MDQNFIMSVSDLILEHKYISVAVIYLWDILVLTCVKYERTVTNLASERDWIRFIEM